MLLKTKETLRESIVPSQAKMDKNPMIGDDNTPQSKYWRYWCVVRLNRMGRCQTEIVEEARIFFEQQFAANFPDGRNGTIQRRLFDLTRDERDGAIAKTCLRCFISNQLKEFCLNLEQKFGRNHDFTVEELLPLALIDEDGEDPERSSGLMTRILNTFDPDKSKLSTWTVRIAKSDRAIRQFLLQRGIEHISDWLLLVQVTPGGLHRLLANVDRTDAEIARSLQLLEQFHQIYRTELLQRHQPGSCRSYPKPTPAQLQRIAQHLTPSPTPQQVFLQLQNLAKLLRSDRLRRRGISLPSDESFDAPQAKNWRDRRTAPEDEQSDFLKEYRQQFDTCLRHAVEISIENRVAYFQQGANTPKRKQKANRKIQQFLTGLLLLYCQYLSMKEIATRIGLRDQPRVSRLLELGNLRSDVTRNILSCLKKRVLQLAQDYVNPHRLRSLATQIDNLLKEEISTIMETDTNEAHAACNRFASSQLAPIICQYLNRRQESHD